MLKIGLPAGAEFALTAVYLFIVYTVCRPFGASAQAAFGIGLRLVQSMFLPVVALGFRGGPGGRAERRRAEGRTACARRSCRRSAWRWRARRSRR